MKKILLIALLFVVLEGKGQNFFWSHSNVKQCEWPSLLAKWFWTYTNCVDEGTVYFSASYEATLIAQQKIVDGCPAGGFLSRALAYNVGSTVYGRQSCLSYCDCPATGYFLEQKTIPTMEDPIYHIVAGVITEIIYPIYP